MSPNTTPMLPSVSAQNPVWTGPSWASVDVTVTAMMTANALSIDLIRRLSTLSWKDCQPASIAPASGAGGRHNATALQRLR